MSSVALTDFERAFPPVFVDAGGLRFEVATDGDPQSDRLALFLHGFPEHAFSWRHQLPVLADQGYRCWAPNLRGYGRTSRPIGAEHYTIDHLVGDVAALVEASGASRVTLLAHDWGAVVAWFAALRGLPRLEALVCMNFPHPKRFAEGLRGARQRLRSWYMLLFQVPGLPEWLLTRRNAALIGQMFTETAIDRDAFPDAVVDVYRTCATEPGAATAMLNWYRAARRHPGLRAEAENAPTLKIPTLLVWGEEDAALGLELTQGTEALVEDFTLRTLPGVSHWVQQEAPDAVNEILRAWLPRLQEGVPDLTPGSPAPAAQATAGGET